MRVRTITLDEGSCKVCLGHGREIDGEQQLELCLDCGLYDYDPSQCVDCRTNSCEHCDGTGEE